MFNKNKLKKISSFGNLFISETKKEIPIKVKRFYFLNNIQKNHWRGFHLHKKLNQIVICIKGSFEFILIKKNIKKKIILKEGYSMVIPNQTWREYRSTSQNSILLVLCDRKYEKKDYRFTK